MKKITSEAPQQSIDIADCRLGPRDEDDIEDPKFVFKDYQICKRLNDGSILRVFRSMLSQPYKVQRIHNPGVLDRRRRPASRERREILLIADRGEAVAFFNRFGNQKGAQH